VCGRRSKYLVVVFWILVVAALGGLAGKLQGAGKNDASAYLPASAESTQELNEQNLFQSKNLNPALVVYVRPGGVTQADMQKADADARYFASLPAVHGRVSPPKIIKGIDSTLLYATLAVVIVLLLLTYRSPVLWLLPILSAGVALTVAQAVIYLLTQHANLTVNGQSEGILVVLVIGASTDYALLLIARYREELRRHADRHQAMAVALRRAGPAIIASGLTVVAGMLCLLAAESNDISGLGPVAAIGIAVGLIAMITLLPAILMVFGRWIFWPARPGCGSTEPTSRGLWTRSALPCTPSRAPTPRWAAARLSTRTWRAPPPMTGTCSSR
jgi:RND superfamily putative drug exporter